MVRAAPSLSTRSEGGLVGWGGCWAPCFSRLLPTACRWVNQHPLHRWEDKVLLRSAG